MDARRGPTLRAQWLGQQLRELRAAAKLTLDDAGAYLQRDPSTVSRFESGEYPIRRPDLMALLDLYRLSDARRREGLLKLGNEIWQTGWWEGYGDHIAGPFIDHAWLEERAHTIRWFETLVVPGLLQTRAYAEATITAGDFTATRDQIDRWVEFRLKRQAVLDEPKPPRLGAILDEAALRRPVGGRAVMRDQLRYLIECGQRPGTEIRVFPFAAGGHPSPHGAFVLFELPEPYPRVGYGQTVSGAMYVEPPDVAPFARVYDRLYEMTLGPEKSADLISAVAEDV